MLLKCCTQYASKFGTLSNGYRTGKGQFSFQSQREAMPKKCSNYCTIALISHASMIMLKILQVGLQQYVNQESPDVQARFRRGRGTRDQTDNICRMIERARKKKKKSTSASLTMLKPLTVWITTNCGIVLKRWEYQTTLPAS